MKVHLLIRMCVLSSKNELYHLEIWLQFSDFIQRKRENLSPNILSKFFYIGFERYIAQKNTDTVPSVI
jgi:hypothetical protein